MPCFYCGVRLRKGGLFQKTKDHVVPKSKGGIRTVDACLKCNARKKDMSLEEFRALCGGIEFYGEREARLYGVDLDHLLEVKWPPPVPKLKIVPSVPNTVDPPAHPKRMIVPQENTRPVYTPTIDPSKIKSYPRGARTKQEREPKPSTPCPPPNLLGATFGAFTVVNRIIGKWVVQCVCGAIEHRTSRAVLNPANSFDACEDCRKPVGKLRSDILKETGVEVTWDDCFQHIYGELLSKRNEEKID